AAGKRALQAHLKNLRLCRRIFILIFGFLCNVTFTCCRKMNGNVFIHLINATEPLVHFPTAL
ncbi:hypothetical protein, partial [Escherichia albertii]|uniref:hypothetical protein n=1 Tax=Escherichia albertii TaxID=208962 RepID=UPI001F390CA3